MSKSSLSNISFSKQARWSRWDHRSLALWETLLDHWKPWHALNGIPFAMVLLKPVPSLQSTEVRFQSNKCPRERKKLEWCTDVFITRINFISITLKKRIITSSWIFDTANCKTLKLSALLLGTRPNVSDNGVYSRTCYFLILSTFVSLFCKSSSFLFKDRKVVGIPRAFVSALFSTSRGLFRTGNIE